MSFAKQAYNYSIGGIISGGQSRATKIENAKFQMKGLLQDYEDADERLQAIMEDVNYGVESTAYGLDAAATVAAQLVASGMEAGDTMKSALRGISGVAAMTNSSYEDIGRIYTTVAGNGRLMGDQLLQLSSRGMNAAATIAKYLNKTEAEVRSMVSAGEIDFETFANAMDNAFGEHAKDANKTLSGVLSNIKAALAKIGADFFTPIIEEDSPLITFLNSVRERINEIRKTISPITSEITTKINNFLTTLNKAFTDKNLFGYNPLANFVDKIKEIKQALDTATAPVKAAAEVFDNAGNVLKTYEELVDEIILR
jgi:tape measure domain-containing protein